MGLRRIFVEKKEGFRIEAECLRRELNENLGLHVQSLRLLNVYDISGFSDELLEKCRYSVFGEKVTDSVTDSVSTDGQQTLAVEYIPGQFDQRASSAVDCVHLIEPEAEVAIRSARLLVFDRTVGERELDAVRHYYINAVESREKDLGRLVANESAEVRPTGTIEGFTDMAEKDYATFCREWGLAMNTDDLKEVVRYFKSEQRNPSETELRILDTYWSDHCRHTTFTTELESVSVEDSFIAPSIRSTMEELEHIRLSLGRERKPMCLMEMATIGARYLRSVGKLDDMEQSEENNACSIFIDVDVDGKTEKWLLQFKNETHNHPTEIEPFGGAATCLGGAIRDPLSGRSYVYQALRITGAGDILKPVSETIPGKLPQRIISRKAASGYSSYGNQIGLATTFVREVYDAGYTAKRMEIGAVVGAVKAENVRRESPAAGDVILLLGGRTGRDGIGGATGSSKEHTESSLETCGSEVQKGNAPEERKLQRLFRRSDVTRLIKKSNDFGAGGVSVAIGELADGLDIYLERVPVKYSGLNATEIAISESQERMAVVVEKGDREAFEQACHEENVEVTYVADVTSTGRMRLYLNGETVADLSREFIDSAGARHFSRSVISAVDCNNPFQAQPEGESIGEKMRNLLSSPNIASQRGLVEMFDSTIGRSTVLLPYGGVTQGTETQISIQKLPTDGYTTTASAMAFGYDPRLSTWSPYHGSAYAVTDAVTKIVAAGGDWRRTRFTFQEYFERMTEDPHSWGKPTAALLGALHMQLELGLASIGGKDSMSGTFEHISVPPTLVAFGIVPMHTYDVVSPEFKVPGEYIYLVRHRFCPDYMPSVENLEANWDFVRKEMERRNVTAAWAVGTGGVAEAVAKMSFGNMVGADICIEEEELFAPLYGSMVITTVDPVSNDCCTLVGHTAGGQRLVINGEEMSIAELRQAWDARYTPVYPQTSTSQMNEVSTPEAAEERSVEPYHGPSVEHPVVYIPVFPGTNCDYDTAKAFRKAGAEVRFGVFRNLTPKDVTDSIAEMAAGIDKCHILAFAGGFSAGDEPDGSGKFIASVLGNSTIAASIHALLDRQGLILGICNGFQALVKSGLLPYGRLGKVTETSPTLFRNDISRHVSQIVTTRVESTSSPWLKGLRSGQTHSIAVSHGEGKFVVSASEAERLFRNGQVAFRYADPVTGEATMESPYNPNGSYYAIEGITSPDGHILGKMGHSERFEQELMQNISGDKDQHLFENAVKYFRGV